MPLTKEQLKAQAAILAMEAAYDLPARRGTLDDVQDKNDDSDDEKDPADDSEDSPDTPMTATDKPLPDKLNRTESAEGDGHEKKMGYKKTELKVEHTKGLNLDQEEEELGRDEGPHPSVGGGGKTPDAKDRLGIKDVGAGAKSTQFTGNYKMQYTAAPKPGFAGEDGPILIKSIVLEPGINLNGWLVRPSQFPVVAAQGKDGAHLRINHSKEMQDVIGKSYNAMTMLGKDVQGWLGREIQGLDPEATYVGAEFEATPRLPQVRTNILQGYVDTGSIGLDADAFCAECNTQLTQGEDGNMHRNCVHLDAPVELDNVKWKEFSYVAEPAFEHTRSFPAFTAKIGLNLNSSLSESKSKTTPVMTDTKVAVAAKIDATARKKADADADADADAEGDADADADARAKKMLSMYKQGQADALQQFRALTATPPDQPGSGDKSPARASADAEGDAEASASFKQGDDPGRGVAPTSASRQTDQIGRVTNVVAPNQRMIAKDQLLMNVLYPSQKAIDDPVMKEIFGKTAESYQAKFGAGLRQTRRVE